MIYRSDATADSIIVGDKIANICIDIALKDYHEVTPDILASFTKDISDTDRSALSRFRGSDIVQYVCASAFLLRPFKDESATVRYWIKLAEAIVSVTCDITEDDDHYTKKLLKEFAERDLYRESREGGRESRKGMRRLKKMLAQRDCNK